MTKLLDAELEFRNHESNVSQNLTVRSIQDVELQGYFAEGLNGRLLHNERSEGPEPYVPQVLLNHFTELIQFFRLGQSKDLMSAKQLPCVLYFVPFLV